MLKVRLKLHRPNLRNSWPNLVRRVRDILLASFLLHTPVDIIKAEEDLYGFVPGHYEGAPQFDVCRCKSDLSIPNNLYVTLFLGANSDCPTSFVRYFW